MRPYLAVIKDSFREALASRTLQVLLALVLLLLLALALPGIRVELASEVAPGDIISAEGLVNKFSRVSGGGLSKAEAAIQKRLPDNVRRQLADYRTDASAEHLDEARDGLVTALNGLITGPALYDAAWHDVDLTEEGRQLLAQGWDELDAPEQRRLNRLLLDGALAGQMSSVAPPKQYLTYLVGEVEMDLPPQAMHTVVKSLVYVLLKWFVGAIGILASIIFTASMIPQMFEPGAIDLLLSKPVSRSALFLTRFLGGCAFILLNAALMIGGLWLILWLRHDIWQPRILLAIPIFLLAFSIYFSISAYVGVKWRNPILAIALALVAWVGTFTLHQVWFWGEQANLNGQRAQVVLDVEGAPLVARRSGELIRWTNGRWEPVLVETLTDPNMAIQRGTGLLYPLIGPVLTGAPGDRSLVAVEALVLPQAGFTQVGKVVTGEESAGWTRVQGPSAPGDIKKLLVTGAGDVLIATRSGIQQLAEPADPAATTPPSAVSGLLEQFTSDGFERLGPPDASWPDPFDAAIDPRTDTVAIYSRGRIVVLRRSGEQFQVVAERVTDGVDAALVAIAGPQVVLVRASGTIEAFALETLEPAGTIGSIEATPRVLTASPDGQRLLLLDHDRRLHLIVSAEKSVKAADVRGQGGINAAAWRADGGWLVADYYPRVTAYSADGSRVEAWESNEGFTWVYVWIINPLRTILPKPDELDLLVREVTGASADESQLATSDLSREQEYFDLWTPLWTNALFVAVVLGWTCWLIERRDY
jgi:hypothetical protein